MDIYKIFKSRGKVLSELGLETSVISHFYQKNKKKKDWCAK